MFELLLKISKIDSDEFWGIKPETDDTNSQFIGSPYSGVQCTGYAWKLCRMFGSMDVKAFGFHSSDKTFQRSSIIEKSFCDGHDFVLIDDRYLVDPWIVLVDGAYDRGCFDLHDRIDESIVDRLYGPREQWKRMKSIEQEKTQCDKAFEDMPPALIAHVLAEHIDCESYDPTGMAVKLFGEALIGADKATVTARLLVVIDRLKTAVVTWDINRS